MTFALTLSDLDDDDSCERDGDSKMTADEADEQHVGRLYQRPHAVTATQTTFVQLFYKLE